jgi:uncharacterized protein
MTPVILIGAFLIAFATMFVGAISGGVGLVLRPLLILLGISAETIIGTVRLSAIPGELPGLFLLYKNKKVDMKLTLFFVIPQLFGSLFAALAVISIFKGWINILLGILLLVAGALLLLNQKLGMKERKVQGSVLRHTIAFIGTFVLSFFSTITGGLGPLFTSLYVTVYGKSYISASAMWRIAGYIGNLIAAAIFVWAGIIDWQLAVALAIGLMLGSYFGTKYGLKWGEKWVRVVVLILVFVGAIKLLFF